MAAALPVDMMTATVQLTQPQSNGSRQQGTGFLVSSPGPDGKPRIVLVTANHVLERMPDKITSIGYRIQNEGAWGYAPQQLTIRDADGKPLWLRHPDRDIAVMKVVAPETIAKAAIPRAWLADGKGLAGGGVQIGDELMTLGFPRGLSSTEKESFPILRFGRVASYPLNPADATFVVDMSVYEGDSGGPVFTTTKTRRPAPFVAGLITQHAERDNQAINLGVVTQAQFVREALDLMDRPAPAAGAPAPSAARVLETTP